MAADLTIRGAEHLAVGTLADALFDHVALPERLPHLECSDGEQRRGRAWRSGLRHASCSAMAPSVTHDGPSCAGHEPAHYDAALSRWPVNRSAASCPR